MSSTDKPDPLVIDTAVPGWIDWNDPDEFLRYDTAPMKPELQYDTDGNIRPYLLSDFSPIVASRVNFIAQRYHHTLEEYCSMYPMGKLTEMELAYIMAYRREKLGKKSLLD